MHINTIKPKEIAPGFLARFIHTETNTIGYIDIKSGAILPEHSHVHTQITQVIEGKLELIIDGVSKVFEPGMVAVIPSNIVHSGKALTECKVTDVFYPVREDYK
ncbi:cupin domain-containing protein [Tenacibaculum sp. 190524A02b]|uniref:Cupin n=1 Tax=Tenacibaculum vairaonense TaxID=3137860 RepID=A0ABP1F5N4_9FLAO